MYAEVGVKGSGGGWSRIAGSGGRTRRAGMEEEVRGRECDKRSSSSGENELVEVEKK